MSKRRIVVLILFIVVVISVILVGIFFVTKDPAWRIKELDFATSDVPSDYSESFLYLHGNDTFEMEIFAFDEKVFAAIGTYRKINKTYEFTYFERWSYSEGETVLSIDTKIETFTYPVEKGLICIKIPSGRIYKFG